MNAMEYFRKPTYACMRHESSLINIYWDGICFKKWNVPLYAPYTFCLSLVVFRIIQSDFYVVWCHNLKTTEMVFNNLHILGPCLSILFYVIYKQASELTWFEVLEEVTEQTCQNCYLRGANLHLSLKACSG